MKDFIRKRLLESLEYYGVTDATKDNYKIGMQEDDEFDFLLNEPEPFNYDALPHMLTLYRILYFDNKEDIKRINRKQLGSHYSLDRKHLIDTRNFEKNKFYVMVTAKAPKNLIDIEATTDWNEQYPYEKEITLKNKGEGAQVVSIEPLNFK